MECVILYRVPGGKVGYVANGETEDDSWQIAVYPNDAAMLDERARMAKVLGL